MLGEEKRTQLRFAVFSMRSTRNVVQQSELTVCLPAKGGKAVWCSGVLLSVCVLLFPLLDPNWASSVLIVFTLLL